MWVGKKITLTFPLFLCSLRYSLSNRCRTDLSASGNNRLMILSVTSYRRGGHYRHCLEYFQSDFVTSYCTEQTAGNTETPDCC